MRVVIIGIGKSGTTATLYAVHSAMPPGTPLLFEPRQSVRVEPDPVVAKVLIDPSYRLDDAFFRQFDRIVLLVRDPRDVLISKALYRSRGASALHRDPSRLQRYVELLRAKESDPRSVPLRRINALFESLASPALGTDDMIEFVLDGVVSFHEKFPDCLVYRYESMVAGDFEPLARYVSLRPEAMRPRVPDDLRRVERTFRAGNWRDWLCPEDVEHYRPRMSAFMERYGYRDDWSLNPEPSIRPGECSEYVLMLAQERRPHFPGDAA